MVPRRAARRQKLSARRLPRGGSSDTLHPGLTKFSGQLALKPLEAKDANGCAIVIGTYEFSAARLDIQPPLDCVWEEKVRCFRVPEDTFDWPEHILPSGGGGVI